MTLGAFRELWGKLYALMILDRGTGNKACAPMAELTSELVTLALNQFKGDEVILRVYSDGASNLSAACNKLGLNHEKSQPGMPQTNGAAEKKV